MCGDGEWEDGGVFDFDDLVCVELGVVEVRGWVVCYCYGVDERIGVVN